MYNKKFMQWVIIALWFLSIFLAGMGRMLVKYPNSFIFYLIISSAIVAWLVQFLEKKGHSDTE